MFAHILSRVQSVFEDVYRKILSVQEFFPSGLRVPWVPVGTTVARARVDVLGRNFLQEISVKCS
jgi:hypothetical protein